MVERDLSLATSRSTVLVLVSRTCFGGVTRVCVTQSADFVCLVIFGFR